MVPAPVNEGSSSRWAQVRAAAGIATAVGAGDRLLVVAAHPDDETLGAGGLLAMAEAAGTKITVLVATDGDASHPHSRTHTACDLAAVRRREVYAALAAVAPSAEVLLLGLPDGGLGSHLEELSAAVLEHAAHCTHVVTPWIDDRHPDHEACARAGAAAARRHAAQHWQYPVWAWHWGDPARGDLPVEGLERLPVDAAGRAAKERGIACYVSQCAPLSAEPGDETVLSPAMLEHFRGDHELFYVWRPAAVVGPGGDGGGSADRFAGGHPGGTDDDPWGSHNRFTERRKRAAVLAALPRPRFRRAFEPGCATGALTIELARRCAELIAWDAADVAVSMTAREVGDLAGAGTVEVALGRIPQEWPAGTFDLIVLNEVGHDCADLAELAARIDSSLTEDGVLVACHWRHPAADHLHNAGDVHGALGEHRRAVVSHVDPEFLLHVWSRPDAPAT